MTKSDQKGVYRETVQGTLRRRSGSSLTPFSEHSDTVQETVKHCSGNIQTPLGEHSDTVRGTFHFDVREGAHFYAHYWDHQQREDLVSHGREGKGIHFAVPLLVSKVDRRQHKPKQPGPPNHLR
jgi:5-hydroxyisourate hydrolase-like protein (transthyretin family)